MSWGAYNICSEGHAVKRNANVNGGAKYAVRYPYEFDSRGLRFWSTPQGAMLDIGRCARSWEHTSWLYKRDQSPSPTVVYEKGTTPGTPSPALHVARINGYDVSQDGPYYANFYQQCNRLVVIQNAQHYLDTSSAYHLDISDADVKYFYPKKTTGPSLSAYNFRPYMSPSMPHDPDGAATWPVFFAKQGMRPWVNDGWAYKKETDHLNNYSQWEFIWDEWEYDIWNVSPNPASGLNKNLLYLVTKTYSHGPLCNGTHIGYPSPRYCNDRQLTGYTPYYWHPTTTPPSHWHKDFFIKSLCVEDEYPYITTGDYDWKHSWAPYSISCGVEGVFSKSRFWETSAPIAGQPYAKTDSYRTIYSEWADVDSYPALCEMIPPKTAFDLMVYLEVVNVEIRDRPYPNARVDNLYWNTKCYSICHQIAPLPPKPF